MVDFLTGNANNLIKTQRDVDAPFERNENYGYLYFSAACYQAERGEPVAEVLKQLKRAFLHGFRDKNRLQEEMTLGMLAKPEIQERIIEELLYSKEEEDL